uniref:Uncharacterized protein n=1 Tax=Rhizophora mucronata TaxID=61149 RepID=A0A2P2R3M1_RHIMU
MILPTQPLVALYPALAVAPSHVWFGFIFLMHINWVVDNLDAYIRHGQPGYLHVTDTR